MSFGISCGPSTVCFGDEGGRLLLLLVGACARLQRRGMSLGIVLWAQDIALVMKAVVCECWWVPVPCFKGRRGMSLAFRTGSVQCFVVKAPFVSAGGCLYHM